MSGYKTGLTPRRKDAKKEARMKHKKLQRLENMAASLNYQLVP